MGTITAQLNFLKPIDSYKTEKPYWLFIGKPETAPDVDLTNVVTETVTDIPVHDVRGHEEKYSLDEHGFQFIKHNQTFQAFEDEERIKTEFLPQVEKVIRENVPYVERVLVYDWRVRKEITEGDPEFITPLQVQDRNYPLAPSIIVHTGKILEQTSCESTANREDTTEFTILKRLKAELPEEAERLAKGRIQMINFWRPMYDEVKNWPLIVCDGRTLQTDSLVAVDQVSRRFVGDVYYATYDPQNKWHYQSSMGSHEGVLFKSWDTAKNIPSKGEGSWSSPVAIHT
ncbi:predicted protein [Uncinocarpus reesii 1704]|uniref:Uncharacterized protein n=1 Tax=Uncinocarpus reesii (strain UAMH 1704) TaxID=336963 RepID=C4JQI5_UNCRE|nr:uncharacterized protein UREG_03330 [Uncinocarpus reesii 1704]EEP78484.1 predicted protein [Uncinocarpus reesii 1704]